MTRLSKERLEGLSTQRLYRILKVVRKDLDTGFYCACCATPFWMFVPGTTREKWEKEFAETRAYFVSLKSILDKRPHLVRTRGHIRAA
jgi:hypothetical protein